MLVEAPQFVIATAADFAVIEDEVLRLVCENCVVTYCDRAMTDQPFRHDVLDWLAVGRGEAENALHSHPLES